jgi:hypothetical protein
MSPELKFKMDFPGFGSVDLVGKCSGKENNFNEVIIKFVPSTPCKDNNGLVIRLCRNGDCIVQELKPLIDEEVFEGDGVA